MVKKFFPAICFQVQHLWKVSSDVSLDWSKPCELTCRGKLNKAYCVLVGVHGLVVRVLYSWFEDCGLGSWTRQCIIFEQNISCCLSSTKLAKMSNYIIDQYPVYIYHRIWGNPFCETMAWERTLIFYIYIACILSPWHYEIVKQLLLSFKQRPTFPVFHENMSCHEKILPWLKAAEDW